MRAWRLHSQQPLGEEKVPLRLEEVPLPVPGPGEVRLRVEACGVCHTDLHIAEGELPAAHLPLTPGHQVVGIIDAIGPRTPAAAGGGAPAAAPGAALTGAPAAASLTETAGGLEIGRRVGLTWLYSACGGCRFCRSGLENLCQNARFTGLHVDGGFAEYVIAPVDFVIPLPPELGAAPEVAPLLCAGMIGYRSLKVAGVRPGETIGLIGFGASAHLVIQVLRHWGCTVFVFTRSEKHRQLARRLGAAWAGGLDETPADRPGSAWPAGGRPGWPGGDRPARDRPAGDRRGGGLDAGICDRVISFAPVGAVIPRALALTRPGGTVAINAVHLDKVPEFPYPLLWRERTLRSVANVTRQDAYEFIELVRTAHLRAEVEVFPFEALPEALLALKQARVQGAPVLLVGAR
ncbi:MAG TPA: zinc-dependent alcohol dehydrogenase family protein [Firmicutes bacterium]|nr:zinc-dependent alcohol dehydrogenase family protein [Bacillota bacterium]